MLTLDSSVWIEYFLKGSSGDRFTKAIIDSGNLLVPSIAIYEVFKRVLAQKGQDFAVTQVRYMLAGNLIELNDVIAIKAAKFSHEKKIPMADSIIYATAQKYKAELWTMDKDLKGLPNVKYFAKK